MHQWTAESTNYIELHFNYYWYYFYSKFSQYNFNLYQYLGLFTVIKQLNNISNNHCSFITNSSKNTVFVYILKKITSDNNSNGK